MEYVQLFTEHLLGYALYLGNEIIHPHGHNYVYWLIAISVVVYGLELWRPWRKQQAPLRQDFFLDAFYMFFNFFLFSLLGFAALSQVAVTAFSDLLALIGIRNLVAIQVGSWPLWLKLLSYFLLRDFLHYQIHRLLHRLPILWEFHKVHHSVLQMGFAAHLRYHPLENIVYRTLEYLPMALIGFGIDDYLVVHLIALSIGHLNHANFSLPLGPLKYLINNARMHIWHHAAEMPAHRPHGINFGISLSLWDYLFATAYIPHDGRDIDLGFPEVEDFPTGFVGQVLWPATKTKVG